MRTYQRNGVQVEQCDSCRGIFLDFGELEALTRLEGQGPVVPQAPGGYPQAPVAYPPAPPAAYPPPQYAQPAPYPQGQYPQGQYPQGQGQYPQGGYQPGWGGHGHHYEERHRKQGFGRLFFSS